jgi:predicted transcriptional regulator
MNKFFQALVITSMTLGLSPAYAQEPAGKPAPAAESQDARTSGQLQQMQENMKKMQEHMQAMRAQMAMMHGMNGGMMMGQGGGTGCTQQGAMMGGDMVKQHQMMRNRMDMMQMMMEQMMQREKAKQDEKPLK